MKNIGVEKQIKQMLQVLLGNESLTVDVSCALEKLNGAGLLTDREIRAFQNRNVETEKE
ncbi:hypothetical protein [Bacillus cereus]|uniref:hypothetical protein n=1 Tax=Bacillus cereus TaxID=1396 RepID=UPI003012D66F